MVSQLYDLIQDALCDLPFRRFGHVDDFVTGNNGDGVAVGIESNALARDIIDDNRVELKRVNYPIDEAVRSIDESGLPEGVRSQLAQVLRSGGMPKTNGEPAV